MARGFASEIPVLPQPVCLGWEVPVDNIAFVILKAPGSDEIFFLVFPIVNIFGGIGDFYSFFRYIILPPEKRIEMANKSDEKVLKHIIWKKDFSLNNQLFSEK